MSAKQSVSREGLLQVINLVKPSLSNQSFIASLTHICFSDGLATSYNDITSISVRTSIDLEVCVPGELLSKALNSLNAKEVSIDTSEEGIILSSGRSKLKLPVIPAADFPFAISEDKTDALISVSEDMLKGIEFCLISVGSDPHHPAHMGVTLEPGKKGGMLYSTDNQTLSRYRTSSKVTLPADTPIILPTFFCNQLITLSKAFPSEEVLLDVRSGCIIAKFGEQATLFTKMVVDLEPTDFQRIIDRYSIDERFTEKCIGIPDDFDSSFNRALLVLSNETDKTTRVTIANDRMKLFSESQYGTSDDAMPFKAEDAEPFYIDPSLVIRASQKCSKVAPLERVMVMSNEDETFTHLISHCITK